MFSQHVKALRLAGFIMQGQGWTDNQTVLDIRRSCIESNNLLRVLHRAIERNPQRNDTEELERLVSNKTRNFWDSVDSLISQQC